LPAGAFIASPDARTLQYIELGRTSLRVSRLAVGTVELGVDYGIHVPGDFGRPNERDALRLLHAAHDAGINFFDTAPAYGVSEELLGKAFEGRPDAIVATKVDVPQDGKPIDRRREVARSVERSLRAIRRDRLDVVQVHNATPIALDGGWLLEALEEARTTGKVRYIGASVYGEEAALSAIQMKVDVIQVAVNLLDQRMVQRVIPAAKRAGTGVMVRSVYLRGVLTSKAQWLSSDMQPIRDAADRARRSLGASWDTLPRLALRFCLSLPGVQTLVVGIRTERDLREALEAAAAGPLDSATLEVARGVALGDNALLDPRQWDKI
jgi:aryl-alcohol dehydrogenase-like predicted oxidoreductase